MTTAHNGLPWQKHRHTLGRLSRWLTILFAFSREHSKGAAAWSKCAIMIGFFTLEINAG